jgi:hypothetical protein
MADSRLLGFKMNACLLEAGDTGKGAGGWRCGGGTAVADVSW